MIYVENILTCSNSSPSSFNGKIVKIVSWGNTSEIGLMVGDETYVFSASDIVAAVENATSNNTGVR